MWNRLESGVYFCSHSLILYFQYLCLPHRISHHFLSVPLCAMAQITLFSSSWPAIPVSLSHRRRPLKTLTCFSASYIKSFDKSIQNLYSAVYLKSKSDHFSLFLSSLKHLTPVSLIVHDNLYLGPLLLIPLLLYTSRNFFFYSLFAYLFFLKLFVLFFIVSFSYSHDSVISFFAYSILEFFHILH